MGESTNEGPAAVQEAITFLENMQPVGELTWSSEMAKACRDHVLDQGPKGATGHTGSDGSTSWSRTARYGTRTGSGECITYGQTTGIAVVMRLLVNDGVPSRAHRKIITDPDHKVVGNFSGPHEKYRMMTT